MERTHTPKLQSRSPEVEASLGSMEDQTPSKARQQRLDQMLEAQMISDILRAHNNLKAFKAFRVTSETQQKEKELAEARKKEIQEPLEAAVFENELLSGKVNRREEMIKSLRRELLLENIKNKSASVSMSREGGSRYQCTGDPKDNEDFRMSILQDEIAELNIIIEYHEKNLANCKEVINIQTKKIKELRDRSEQSEYDFQGKIRKIDQDKDIYLGMIESRESKIEKLMEDNDELNEQIAELSDEVDKAKGAKIHAQKLMEEYKVKALDAIKVKEEAESKFDDYVEQIKILREGNIEYSEKIIDLQNRYDNLVLELDRMVEEGYYIPDSTATKNPKSVSKRRQNKIAKPQDLLKIASYKAKKSKVTIAQGNPEVVGTERNDDYTRHSSSDNIPPTGSSSQPMSRNFSNINMAAPTLTINTANNQKEEEDYEEDDDEDSSSIGYRPKSADSGNTNDDGTAPVTPRMGRFSMRKIQEDALLQEKLAAHAATRMKDSLQEKITVLESQLVAEKEGRKEDAKKISITKDSLELGQRVLAAEVSRLTQKISDLEKNLVEKTEELALAQSAAKFAGLRQSELVSRLSVINVQKNRQPPPKPSPAKDETPKDECIGVGTESVEPKQQKKRKTATTSSACGPDLEDYVHLDVLTYMYDWDKTQKYSKATETEELILKDGQVQCSNEDFILDQTLLVVNDEDYDSQREEIKSNTSGKRSRLATPLTSLFAHQTEIKVLREDPEVMEQLEKLHEGFVKICTKYLPKQKRNLFLLSQDKALVKQGLLPQDLLPNVDIQWQVQNTLTLLIALNEMRNQFVLAHLNPNQGDDEKKNGNDGLETSNVKSSDYPNLNDMFDIMSTPANPDVLVEGSDIYTKKLREQASKLMDDTFPLTEISLTTDPTHGAPRGVLSLLDEFQRRKKVFRSGSPSSRRSGSGCNGDSNPNSRNNSPSPSRQSPRTFPMNIDEVLDLLERQSRGNSPNFSPSRRGPVDAESVDSNDDARKYAVQILEEVSMIEAGLEDGFVALALPETDGIPFPNKITDRSTTAPRAPSPDFVNYKKLIQIHDQKRPNEIDNEYIDYTRFVFNKDHIINNAYAVNTRRAVSANSREKRVRIEGSEIIGSVDKKDGQRQEFPRIHYYDKESNCSSGTRPYSAHPPGSASATPNASVRKPALETVDSIASSTDDASGVKITDSSTLATGGSIIVPKPPGGKKAASQKDRRVQQAPHSPHHTHRNIIPPNVRFSRTELSGQTNPVNSSIELAGSTLEHYLAQTNRNTTTTSQTNLAEQNKRSARLHSANRTTNVESQPPLRYYNPPAVSQSLFPSSDEPNYTTMKIKETQIGEYIVSHSKQNDPVSPYSTVRSRGGVEEGVSREGLLSVQGTKRTTNVGNRERVTNAMLYM